MARQHWKLAPGHLAVVGAGVGFLTGLVVATGPINAPFFLAYGLVKWSYLSTEALGSLAVYISKAITFRTFGALPTDIIVQGLITGSSVMAGTYLAKRLVERLSIASFQRLLDVVMLLSGCSLLWAALDWR